jgi:hypothetical protein
MVRVMIRLRVIILFLGGGVIRNFFLVLKKLV